MALRILNRCLIARPIHTLQKLLSQAQPSIATDKPLVNAAQEVLEDEPDFDVLPPLTPENNPVNHNESHVAYFYRLSKPVLNKLMFMTDYYRDTGFAKDFMQQALMFQEACIMVRKPALEIINNLKRADYEKPAIRQVLYGPFGCGKSITLNHVLHYAYKANYLLVNVPWTNDFTRHARVVQPSNFVEGAMDVPVDGSTWLKRFKSQNSHILSNPDIVTSNHYQWNDHECTEKGKPLMELVEYGCNRALHSNRVIDTLLKEVKAYSIAGLFRTLVVIDGFNGLYTNCVINTKRIVHKGRLSIAQSFIDMTNFDWCNAAIVVTVDGLTHSATDYKPFELLGKQGWEQLDPFIPVEIGTYTYAEAQNSLEYYIQKKWLINPAAKTPQGRDELISLSGRNPRELFKICNPL